jgi:hypothetical protein
MTPSLSDRLILAGCLAFGAYWVLSIIGAGLAPWH